MVAHEPSGSIALPKCLVGLTHVARAIFETGEFFQEGEGNFADGTVALLGDDQFGFALTEIFNG